MLLIDAIRKAEKDRAVKELSKTHFLCSAFAFIKDDGVKEWVLHYFSPESKKMTDCVVGSSVNIGDETPAIKEMEKLDAKKVKVSSDKAIKTAGKDFDKKKISSMVSLHKKDKIVWTVSMITQDMMITSFDVDAMTGKITGRKEESLLRGGKMGS